MTLQPVNPGYVVKSEKREALRRFDVTCENTLRRVSYTLHVWAADQRDAQWTAREFIKDNNLVSAERMVVSAEFEPHPSDGQDDDYYAHYPTEGMGY